jgi:hypothetical protein
MANLEEASQAAITSSTISDEGTEQAEQGTKTKNVCGITTITAS